MCCFFPAYQQAKQSRLSCDLNQLLKFGFDAKKLQYQKEDMAEQISDMQEMLKHQQNEIQDLEVWFASHRKISKKPISGKVAILHVCDLFTCTCTSKVIIVVKV
jgi:predicted RNase H-like nuclease (RuvC/YqgF family)